MWGTEPGTYFTFSNLNFGCWRLSWSPKRDLTCGCATLCPLNMNASFAIQDLESKIWLCCTVGDWIPQVDNLGGTMPAAPDLTAYTPGTNAARFPQGGLRCNP